MIDILCRWRYVPFGQLPLGVFLCVFLPIYLKSLQNIAIHCVYSVFGTFSSKIPIVSATAQSLFYILSIVAFTMAKPMVKLFTNLENEFQTLQKSLSDIDSDIRKVTGKDPG